MRQTTNLTFLFKLQQRWEEKKDCSIGIQKMFIDESSIEVRDSSVTATYPERSIHGAVSYDNFFQCNPVTFTKKSLSFQENMFKANVNFLKQYQIIINLFKTLFHLTSPASMRQKMRHGTCSGYDKDLCLWIIFIHRKGKCIQLYLSLLALITNRHRSNAEQNFSEQTLRELRERAAAWK